MTIPGTKVVFSQESRNAILEEIAEVLDTGQMSNGRFVARFEESFRRLAAPGSRHVVAVSSGTGALEIALRALGVSASYVICPSNTYAATAWAILAAGNTPLFVGWDDELQISVDDVERVLIRDQQRPVGAVVVTHVGGVVSRHVAEIASMCRARGVPLIEDAAHAHGARLGSAHAGTLGDAAAFSLFATKVVTSGEGGIITFRDAEDAATARLLRDQGKKPGTGNLHLMRGYNWRMSEAHAVIGHHHALSFPERWRSRARAASMYDRELSTIPGLTPLPLGEDRVSSFYKYVVLTDPERDLARVPLAGRVYEEPLHTQAVFGRCSLSAVGALHPNLGRHRCLPLYDHMSDPEVREVTAALQASLSQPV